MRNVKLLRGLARALLLCVGVSLSSVSHAQSVVPQSGPNPFPINQTATTDNLVALPAGAAERLDSAYLYVQGAPKYMWVSHFDNTDEYFKWTVSLRSAATYRLTALISAGSVGATFNVLVDGAQASSGTSTRNEWDRLSLGTITLPAGQHTITLKRAAVGPSAELKSIELLRESDAAGVAPSHTDFQDVSFGEICKPNAAPIGGDGRYQSGPEKGLAGHCMETMENDWGIHAANQGASAPYYSAQTLFNTVAPRTRQKLPTSVNLLMWEDGSISPASLAVLQGTKRLFDDAAGCTFGCERYNNDNAAITYSGSWGRSTNRNAGDFGNDVNYTTVNGDAATINFTGGAIRLFAPKNIDYGDFEVLLDGVSQGTFSAYNASSYLPRQLVYSKAGLTYGNDMLKIIKRGGAYMQIDHVDVDQSITRINDTSNAITKTGSWNYASNRTADDYQNDVSYTFTNGDTFSYAFTGTGVQILMPRDTGQGDVEFFIDGVSQGQAGTRAPFDYHPQQVMFSIKDLAPGQHTVSGRKINGNYMQFDAIEITGN